MKGVKKEFFDTFFLLSSVEVLGNFLTLKHVNFRN